MSTIRLEHALLEDGVADDVLLEVEGGRIEFGQGYRAIHDVVG